MIRRHPRALLTLYVEGNLSSQEEKTVAAHLQRCSACTEAVAVMRPLRQTLQRLPKPSPPAWLTQRILARYDALQRRASFWNGFEAIPRLLQPALVALLLLIAFLLLWPARQESLYDQAVKTYAATYDNESSWTALANDEDALRFVLNQPAEPLQESDHDR